MGFRKVSILSNLVSTFASLGVQGARVLASLKIISAGVGGLLLGVAADKMTSPTATDKANTELLMTAAMRTDAANKLQTRFQNEYADYQYKLRQQAQGKDKARSMRV